MPVLLRDQTYHAYDDAGTDIIKCPTLSPLYIIQGSMKEMERDWKEALPLPCTPLTMAVHMQQRHLNVQWNCHNFSLCRSQLCEF